MTYRPSRHTVASLLTAGILIGCASQTPLERVVRDVQFSGYYNEIKGELSDGTPFTGVGWFRPNSTSGDFCLQSAETICSGEYNSTLTRRISGDFVCANGKTGTYVTERIRSGDFVRAISATGTFSDGRTATATFSAIKQGTGTTTCFVPAT